MTVFRLTAALVITYIKSHDCVISLPQPESLQDMVHSRNCIMLYVTTVMYGTISLVWAPWVVLCLVYLYWMFRWRWRKFLCSVFFLYSYFWVWCFFEVVRNVRNKKEGFCLGNHQINPLKSSHSCRKVRVVLSKSHPIPLELRDPFNGDTAYWAI